MRWRPTQCKDRLRQIDTAREKKPFINTPAASTKFSDAPEPRQPQDNLKQILSKMIQQQRETALPKAELNTFDGTDILTYGTFKRNFKYVVEDNSSDAVRRLEFLLKYTSGEVRKLIDQCAMIDPPEAGYTRAKWFLDKDYGQSPLMAAAYRSKAEGWPRIPASEKEALRRYSVFVTNLCCGKISNPE